MDRAGSTEHQLDTLPKFLISRSLIGRKKFYLIFSSFFHMSAHFFDFRKKKFEKEPKAPITDKPRQTARKFSTNVLEEIRYGEHNQTPPRYVLILRDFQQILRTKIIRLYNNCFIIGKPQATKMQMSILPNVSQR